MQYLSDFSLASEQQEIDFIFSLSKIDMTCYNRNNAYPFHIFPNKGLKRLEFAPITILYGGNGSGKSTVLNIIAEKLRLHRSAPFNRAPEFETYLKFCSYHANEQVGIPSESCILTSDGVFDFLLNLRAINDGVDRNREDIFREYEEIIADCRDNGWQMRSLDDYDELKRRNEARRSTKSRYTARRMNGIEVDLKSNGESAFVYFTQKITENALYLLDEPENSLSAALQQELARFLEDSARFYGCQFILSTHSPFLLSMKGARIYDLDSVPASVKPWTELPNVRAYYELFSSHKDEF